MITGFRGENAVLVMDGLERLIATSCITVIANSGYIVGGCIGQLLYNSDC